MTYHVGIDLGTTHSAVAWIDATGRRNLTLETFRTVEVEYSHGLALTTVIQRRRGRKIWSTTTEEEAACGIWS